MPAASTASGNIARTDAGRVSGPARARLYRMPACGPGPGVHRILRSIGFGEGCGVDRPAPLPRNLRHAGMSSPLLMFQSLVGLETRANLTQHCEPQGWAIGYECADAEENLAAQALPESLASRGNEKEGSSLSALPLGEPFKICSSDGTSTDTVQPWSKTSLR